MKKYDELFAKSSRIGLSPSPASVSETTSSSTDTGGGSNRSFHQAVVQVLKVNLLMLVVV